MKQKTTKTIIFSLIFAFIFLGTGSYIKEANAQSSDTTTSQALQNISKLLTIIVERLSVLSVKDGNLGVGTADPESLLSIKTDENKGKPLLLVETSGTVYDAITARFIRTDIWDNWIEIDSAGNNQGIRFSKEGSLSWRIGSFSDDFRLYDTEGHTATISASQGGNVGIGTIHPEEKLHVKGNLKVDGNIIGGSPVKIAEGLETKNAKISDELCVGNICVTEEEFKAVFGDM